MKDPHQTDPDKFSDVTPHACRDIKRRLLAEVDRRGSLSRRMLLTYISSSRCAAGHRLVLHDLQASKSLRADSKDHGLLVLSDEGQEWLYRHGQPVPDWGISLPAGLPPLRAWQSEALDSWADHGRHGVVNAVTGTGKSRVGVEAIREARRDHYSVVVCVPTSSLVDQWLRTLAQSGIPGATRYGPGTDISDRQLVVGTVQSLYQNPPTRHDGQVLLVADECHRYGSTQWANVLHKSYRRRLGLTATFERSDDGLTALLSYFGGAPLFDIGFQRAIADDVVAPYHLKLLGVPLSTPERTEYDKSVAALAECRIKLRNFGLTMEPFGVFMSAVSRLANDETAMTARRDTARRFLKEFSNRIDIVSGAGNKTLALERIRPLLNASRGALVFNSRIEATEVIARAIRQPDFSCEALHSRLGDAERAHLLFEFKSKRVRALTTATMLDEGVDVPDADLGVVMSGTRSRRQMIQRMGRVLRRKADGRPATFVIVYALDTIEDVRGALHGSESHLDLLVQNAASVEQLGGDFQTTLSQTPAVSVPTPAARAGFKPLRLPGEASAIVRSVAGPPPPPLPTRTNQSRPGVGGIRRETMIATPKASPSGKRPQLSGERRQEPAIRPAMPGPPMPPSPRAPNPRPGRSGPEDREPEQTSDSAPSASGGRVAPAPQTGEPSFDPDSTQSAWVQQSDSRGASGRSESVVGRKVPDPDASAGDPVSQLLRLAGMLEAGLIDNDEFRLMKAYIFRRLP